MNLPPDFDAADELLEDAAAQINARLEGLAIQAAPAAEQIIEGLLFGSAATYRPRVRPPVCTCSDSPFTRRHVPDLRLGEHFVFCDYWPPNLREIKAERRVTA